MDIAGIAFISCKTSKASSSMITTGDIERSLAFIALKRNYPYSGWSALLVTSDISWSGFYVNGSDEFIPWDSDIIKAVSRRRYGKKMNIGNEIMTLGRGLKITENVVGSKVWNSITGTYAWTFVVASVSGLFTHLFTETWSERMGDDTWADIWGPVMESLDTVEGPVDIALQIEYLVGTTEHDGIPIILRDVRQTSSRVVALISEHNSSYDYLIGILSDFTITRIERFEDRNEEAGGQE